MYRDNLLPIKTKFVGYARSKLSNNELRAKCDQYMNVRKNEIEKYEEFWELNHYIAGEYDKKQDFEVLNDCVSSYENESHANRLFYLALPPSAFQTVTVHIRNTCFCNK